MTKLWPKNAFFEITVAKQTKTQKPIFLELYFYLQLVGNCKQFKAQQIKKSGNKKSAHFQKTISHFIFKSF